MGMAFFVPEVFKSHGQRNKPLGCLSAASAVQVFLSKIHFTSVKSPGSFDVLGLWGQSHQ